MIVYAIQNKKILGLLIFALLIIAPFTRAQGLAQQPCYSSRGGYCLKLVAPKNYQSSVPGAAGSSFAAVAGTAPGLEFLPGSANLGDLLASLYYFMLSIVGISALVMFVWGGIEYMLAGDKSPATARARMSNAVFGLVLALTAYTILWTINPDLVTRLNINLDPIAAPPAATDKGSGSASSPASTQPQTQSPTQPPAQCTSTPDNCGSGFKCVGGKCIEL